ncbi:neo-calmodulin-like isoform X2 [Apostichopus japonicus]|uniref:neo-calmodulin-like isoform X1 n=1 Tax=Stichopus japonicus TaxID=307972 RepID=UPI003AB864D4
MATPKNFRNRNYFWRKLSSDEISSVDELTPEQRHEFKEAFLLFDQDKDGVISANELEKVMKLLKQDTSEEEIREMFDEADTDGNGAIDFKEFLTMMANKMSKHSIDDGMKQAFKVFETDIKGHVSADDIRHVMKTYGDTLPTEDVEEMLRVAGVDGDGNIDYMDYVRKVSSTVQEID